MLEIQAEKDKYYNWIVVPDAYLGVALYICKKIRSKNNFVGSIIYGSEFFRNLNFRSHHPNYELIYPVIYNLKHGVELYLKGLGCLSHNKYAAMHDLKELFDYIVKNANINNKNVLTVLYNETWSVISKYYYGTYIPYIVDDSRPDKCNEAERYPETRIAYDISNPYQWVTNSLIDTIIKDIEFVESKFSQAKRDIL